jgi:hypothetical protein
MSAPFRGSPVSTMPTAIRGAISQNSTAPLTALGHRGHLLLPRKGGSCDYDPLLCGPVLPGPFPAVAASGQPAGRRPGRRCSCRPRRRSLPLYLGAGRRRVPLPWHRSRCRVHASAGSARRVRRLQRRRRVLFWGQRSRCFLVEGRRAPNAPVPLQRCRARLPGLAFN